MTTRLPPHRLKRVSPSLHCIALAPLLQQWLSPPCSISAVRVFVFPVCDSLRYSGRLFESFDDARSLAGAVNPRIMMASEIPARFV